MVDEENIQGPYLVLSHQKIPFEAVAASKYSLQVRFRNGFRLHGGIEFAKMVMPIDKKSAVLGRGKLLSEPDGETLALWLRKIPYVLGQETVGVDGRQLKLIEITA